MWWYYTQCQLILLLLSSLLFFIFLFSFLISLHFSIRTYLCECLLLLQGVCVALREFREAFGHLVVLRLELPTERRRRRGRWGGRKREDEVEVKRGAVTVK
jgi:hypothetical protein